MLFGRKEICNKVRPGVVLSKKVLHSGDGKEEDILPSHLDEKVSEFRVVQWNFLGENNS